jgi:hypothetical protein
MKQLEITVKLTEKQADDLEHCFDVYWYRLRDDHADDSPEVRRFDTMCNKFGKALKKARKVREKDQ